MDEKKIHSIIDEAMAARDRSVSIYISPDGGVSVSVFPWPDEETLRNMRASGLISHNDYRTRHSAMTMLSWRFPMVQSSAGKLKAGKTMMTAIRFR